MSSIPPIGGGSSYPLPPNDVESANHLRQAISPFKESLQNADPNNEADLTAFGSSILNLDELTRRT